MMIVSTLNSNHIPISASSASLRFHLLLWKRRGREERGVA
jgi:hypothetical protein